MADFLGGLSKSLGSFWTRRGEILLHRQSGSVRAEVTTAADSLKNGGIRQRHRDHLTWNNPRFKPILPICSGCLGASVNDYFSQQISHWSSFFTLPVCCLDDRSCASCQLPPPAATQAWDVPQSLMNYSSARMMLANYFIWWERFIFGKGEANMFIIPR